MDGKTGNRMHRSGASFYYTEGSSPSLSPLLDVPDEGGCYRFTLLTGHAGERYTAPRRRREHRHAVYHVVLYTEGVNRFSYNGTEAECRPGSLVLCPPGRSHSFAPLDEGEVAYHELTFAYRREDGRGADSASLAWSVNALLTRIACRPVRLPEILPLPADRMKQCERIMKSIIIPVYRDARDDFRCSLRIIRLFRFLIAAAVEMQEDGRREGAASASAAVPAAYRKAAAYIRRHYRRNVSIRRLARRAGVTCEHFCRQFKRYYGFSPGRYQTELRLRAARAMLRTGGRQCGEIAERLGFSDRYFFSKVFKKYTGYAPSVYRSTQSSDTSSS
jgi:AraC-like DNA-binding protein/mannose-6-phosphate isomerase-like protein (cupin superfamily)